MATDWGFKLFVLKLDFEKAFETVMQAQLGKLVLYKVTIEGRAPWKARGWLQFMQPDHLVIATDETPIHVQQTKGLQQG